MSRRSGGERRKVFDALGTPPVFWRLPFDWPQPIGWMAVIASLIVVALLLSPLVLV
jgi:hypothetical protein